MSKDTNTKEIELLEYYNKWDFIQDCFVNIFIKGLVYGTMAGMSHLFIYKFLTTKFNK